jgi:hypothetical protein
MAEYFGTAVTIILHRRNFWLSNIWQEARNSNQEDQQKKLSILLSVELLTDKSSKIQKVLSSKNGQIELSYYCRPKCSISTN